jgi:hypothetical protein
MRPGWSFELVLTNPRQVVQQTRHVLDEDDIDHYIQMADELKQRGYWPGSYLVGWAAIEALIRILLTKSNKRSDELQPLAAVKTAYSLGLLGQTDYGLLERCFETRNRLAHGFKSDWVNPSDVADMIDLARRLKGELRFPPNHDDAGGGDGRPSFNT